jgi:hypothetical protein
VTQIAPLPPVAATKVAVDPTVLETSEVPQVDEPYFSVSPALAATVSANAAVTATLTVLPTVGSFRSVTLEPSASPVLV